jgi:F0F1-type ATP synthase membrane subunit b/b'
VSTTVYHWINFFVLFGFLAFVLKKQLGRYFIAQRKSLESGIQEAKAEHEKISQEHAKIKKLLADIDSKISSMSVSASKEIELETTRLREDGARLAEQVKQDGINRIQAAAAKASKEIQKELFAAALVEAKKKLAEDSKKVHPTWTDQVIQSEQQPARKKNYG